MGRAFPRSYSLALSVALCAHFFSHAAEPHDPAGGVTGALLLHGGGEIPQAVADIFFKASGAAQARVVFIAPNLEKKDSPKVPEVFQKAGAASLKVIELREPKDFSDEKLLEPIKDAAGVWIASADDPALFQKAYAGSLFEKELQAVLKREGMVAASGKTAALFGAVCTDCPGLKLLPGCLVRLRSADGSSAILTGALKQNPELVGFELDPDSALVCSGRNLAALGSRVHFAIAASTSRAARDEWLQPNRAADLIALQRSAIERTRPVFPPAKLEAPQVPSGTLVIDGGEIAKIALTRFIEAAGGPDALIVAIPTAMGDTPPENPGEARMLQRAGAKNVKIFHLATKRADAFDEEKIKILREAKGIWFCGGRQWRYVDAYIDSPAEKLMHDVLKRGGVIGGSSAGATIQGEYLVRGNPLGNMQMMAEGYERGFGFLKGVAIDQHFTQRNRFKDMTALKKTFPQIVGLGIDEGATAIVTGKKLEVVGAGQVAIYSLSARANDEKDYISVKAGEAFDLSNVVEMKH